MNTQTMTPKAVHPTMNLNGPKTKKVVGDNVYEEHTEPCDGFVIFCNDDYAYDYIDEPAKLQQLKAWNAELIITSESYQRMSQYKTSKGSYKNTYLPGKSLGSL